MTDSSNAVLTSLSHVRNRLRIYLRTAPISPSEICSLILNDVSYKDAEHVSLRIDSSRVLLITSHDWINIGHREIRELFEGLHLQKGSPNPNEVRAEIIVNAVSSKLYTIGPAGQYTKNISAEEMLMLKKENRPENGRLLFFEIDQSIRSFS